uniref:Putative isac anti-complement n=1 Tax=Ixodes ricinus TaxID=34613 RepID=A0A0K8RLI4_IXORI
MDIKWMLAYFSLSILLVLGNVQKVKSSAKETPSEPTEPAISKATAAEKKAVVTKKAADNKKTTLKTTAAPQPPAPIPSTDTIICDLKNNQSEFALSSLQCTLRELPENLKGNLTNYIENWRKE